MSDWMPMRRADRPQRPDEVYNPMLQHERTALAWERTAIACMVAGLLFVRYASTWHDMLTLAGFAQVLFGGGLLVWAGYHYEALHGPLRAGDSPVHPSAARAVGLVVSGFTGLAFLSALALSLAG